MLESERRRLRGPSPQEERDLYKQQRDELLAALEPVAEIAAELEAKGYFDGCWEEANVYPNDVELSVADLKRARRAAERARKGQ